MVYKNSIPFEEQMEEEEGEIGNSEAIWDEGNDIMELRAPAEEGDTEVDEDRQQRPPVSGNTARRPPPQASAPNRRRTASQVPLDDDSPVGQRACRPPYWSLRGM
jgi:hypothetical protein